MRIARTATWLAGAMLPAAAAAQTAAPPTLDCTRGFAALQAEAQALPGAAHAHEGGFDVVRLSAPDAWRVQILFTVPGHPAHPAATVRTLRKQVTEVWTADSKGCGYGDRQQFAILMADMKSGDTELSNASRAEVERKKRDRSLLGP